MKPTNVRKITIDHTKCGSQDSFSFPMLFVGTFDGSTSGPLDLRVTGSGGPVVNANGYDITFWDSTLSYMLKWETRLYTGSTGVASYWIQIPQVSASTDSFIWISYGDPTITTDQSQAGTGRRVWDSVYKTVYHMDENAANTTVVDASGNMNAGAAVNTSALATSGGVGATSYFTFNGTSTYLAAGSTGIGFQETQPFTISCWINTADTSGIIATTLFFSSTTGFVFDVGRISAGNVGLAILSNGNFGVGRSGYGSSNVSVSAWRHIVGVYDGTSSSTGIHIYVNGVADTITQNINTTPGASAANPTLGVASYSFGNTYLAAGMDELRIAAANRSASWALTEYNNQSNPSTFFTVGAQLILSRLPISSTGGIKPYAFAPGLSR